MQDTVKEAFSAQRANAGNPSLWRLSVFRRFEQKRKGWGILATPAQVPATVYKTVVAADLYQGRKRGYYGRHLPPKVYGSLPTTVGEIISKPDAVAELITAAASNS
jgi:hypothetical protein